MRNSSVTAGCYHATLEENICKWNRSSSYISKRITFAYRCRICSSMIFILFIYLDILAKVNSVSRQLQDKQTDLGKAAQLISLISENLVNIRNSNLTELYSDSILELYKKCNISLTISCKWRKPKQLDEFIVLEFTGKRSTTSSSSDIYINIFYLILHSFINELDNRFSNESLVIFRDISAFYPGGHTFLFIEDLKDYATAYLPNASDLQHEIPFVRKLRLKQPNSLFFLISYSEEIVISTWVCCSFPC